MARIDPRAVVSPQAQIADDVEVGPFAVIGPDVTIGPGCRIAAHAVVQGPTVMGSGNQVFQFASIGDAPQDKKYKGEPTRLEVGDRNVFREYVTVNRGTVTGRAVTRIGNDNMLLAYSHVAHDCVLGNNIVLSNAVMLGGHVELGDWVIMSGYAGVHQFTEGRRARLHRQQHGGHARRAALCAGHRPARRAARGQQRRPEAPRLQRGADPRHPQCVSRAVSQRPEAGGGGAAPAGDGGGARLPEDLRRLHRAVDPQPGPVATPWWHR